MIKEFESPTANKILDFVLWCVGLSSAVFGVCLSIGICLIAIDVVRLIAWHIFGGI